MRKVFLLVVCLGVAVAALGDEQPRDDATPVFQTRTGFFGTARVGLNLLASPSNTNSDDVITFLGGVGANYFVIPPVGFFLDAQYTLRGFKVGAFSNTASYLDVPFGIAFNFGRSFFSEYARSETRLGGFYAVPLNDFSGNLPTSLSSKASGFFGIYIDSDTLFSVSENLALGYTLWSKIGLGNVVSGFDSKYFEFGLGFLVGFF